MPDIAVNYYPQCYAPFRELGAYQDKLQKRMAGYTAAGAASGAAVGALTGFLAASWQGALAGGIAGSVVGAAAGFTMAKIEEIEDEQRRLHAYRQVMGADLAHATNVELAALQSLRCYIQAFEQLQEALAAQRITREEFGRRYAEIRQGVAELGRITGNSQALMAQHDMEMRASLQKELSRGQSAMEPLPSVEQRRMQRELQARKPAARQQRRQRGRRSVPVPPQPAASSPQGLAQVKAELDGLAAQAREDRARLQAQRQADPPPKPGQSLATAPLPPTPVSAQHVASAYDDYPEKVLQLEAVEQQRKATLRIMDEAASLTGINMV